MFIWIAIKQNIYIILLIYLHIVYCTINNKKIVIKYDRYLIVFCNYNCNSVTNYDK